MYIADRFVFVQLHKTGCTHVVNLLKRFVSGRRKGKHNAPPPVLLDSGRVCLGSIRDPWDWYVSLWAYGCDRKGAVYIMTFDQGLLRLLGLGWRTDRERAWERLRNQRPRHPRAWQRVYADVDDPGGFRDWLHMMHSPDYWEEYGEGYAYSPVNRYAGLLTYRYLKLFCRQSASDNHEHLLSFDEMVRFEERNCFIDHFIRNERLEDDLLETLHRVGVRLSKEQEAEIRASRRTNTSSRRTDVAHYHDENTVSLIAERERLIIDKFGYSAPSLG